MPPLSNLGGLLQPFDEQSPINLISMIAQAGLQNPELLAGILANKGTPVPIGGGPEGGAARGFTPRFAPAPPATPGPGMINLPGTAGAIAPAAGVPPRTPPRGPGGPQPTPLPTPAAAPAGVPQAPPGRAQGILEAVSKLEAPPLPELASPPSAIRPGLGGPGPNPALLAALMQLLQGGAGQTPAIPTLGQLIGGGGSATASPALSL